MNDQTLKTTMVLSFTFMVLVNTVEDKLTLPNYLVNLAMTFSVWIQEDTEKVRANTY